MANQFEVIVVGGHAGCEAAAAAARMGALVGLIIMRADRIGRCHNPAIGGLEKVIWFEKLTRLMGLWGELLTGFDSEC